MYCKNCGKEVAAGERFCGQCGARMESVCPACGNGLEEGARFCRQCGYRLEEEKDRSETISPAEKQRSSTSDFWKVQRLIGILDVIAAGILLLIGLVDIDYAWGDVALCSGIGLLVIGILSLLRKSLKSISINGIVFGGVAILLGLAGETTLSWDVISFFIGVALLVPGILILLQKPWKVISIVEIVFDGLVLLMGIGEAEYDWGLTGLIAGALFLAVGIIRFVNVKKLYDPIHNGKE